MWSVGRVSPVTLVDIGALNLAAGELLRLLDNAAQGVAVIWIAGQRFGMEHELSARCAAIGRNDRSFYAEFVRRVRLSFANALHLWSVKRIELPAALTLLL